MICSEPHPQSVVPRRRAEGRAIRRHAHCADAILMAEEDGHSVALQHIPDVDGVVVIPGKQQAACRQGRFDKFHSSKRFSSKRFIGVSPIMSMKVDGYNDLPSSAN